MGTPVNYSVENFDLSKLVNTKSAGDVYLEVSKIISGIFNDFHFNTLNDVFDDTVKLYTGRYSGYRECNTKYHDLKHTMDVFLTMARLIHGQHLDGSRFDKHLVLIGLIGTLLHDSGYIQSVDDADGTGAKYTLIHVERSVQFMYRYFDGHGYSNNDAEICGRFITATDLNIKIAQIPFKSEDEKSIGKSLIAADLLGQMSDRIYLEKLFYLYQEFSEANVPGFSHEHELFAKTPLFCDFMMNRLDTEIGYDRNTMKNHFKSHWDIDHDLYSDAAVKNISYLKHILQTHGKNFKLMLKRDGIVESIYC